MAVESNPNDTDVATPVFANFSYEAFLPTRLTEESSEIAFVDNAGQIIKKVCSTFRPLHQPLPADVEIELVVVLKGIPRWAVIIRSATGTRSLRTMSTSTDF